ncbi:MULTISPECIES: chemotaxis protein CheW [Cyanophyceae]|uniref:Chemotaxis protein CheW n=1 Tax=Nodularia spumigena CENA596 TaxID=1819295 RepID=A0A166KD06_NODSP|nr:MULTISPECIES: chemotaxis protein CheW [Cyanophyceae]MDB9354965.1 chemotaxis protein CheW [Nodularia spumigena CS-587/03]KZL50930.1 chemotaxis protein CheW [Nodularia spumigena CENA596]MDB9304663.1 chemotaxis protein CheW [Nodularia spumigena CS-591/12]MDB9319311.1 chemotaxis protein CheW [Nodularia spumigena CS-590/01A]MDB9321340.1 chemotaxis protein CheW [Nodularia spumigena CS-591/07A]
MNNSIIRVEEQLSANNLENGYLQFKLNQQTTAILSMNYTQEAVILPVESVTSMPNMLPCVLGLMNWRSRIIWAIDLPRMLNLEFLDGRLRQYNIIVIQVESLLLGLVVHEVKGITKFISDDIESPVGQVASSLVPYLSGCVVQEEEILLVLDAQSIIDSPIFRSE